MTRQEAIESARYWLEVWKNDGLTGSDAKIMQDALDVVLNDTAHDFAWAVARVMEGKRVRKASWPNKDEVLYLENYPGICLSSLMRGTPAGMWSALVFATDWEIAP